MAMPTFNQMLPDTSRMQPQTLDLNTFGGFGAPQMGTRQPFGFNPRPQAVPPINFGGGYGPFFGQQGMPGWTNPFSYGGTFPWLRGMFPTAAGQMGRYPMMTKAGAGMVSPRAGGNIGPPGQPQPVNGSMNQAGMLGLLGGGITPPSFNPFFGGLY